MGSYPGGPKTPRRPWRGSRGSIEVTKIKFYNNLVYKVLSGPLRWLRVRKDSLIVLRVLGAKRLWTTDHMLACPMLLFETSTNKKQDKAKKIQLSKSFFIVYLMGGSTINDVTAFS